MSIIDTKQIESNLDDPAWDYDRDVSVMKTDYWSQAEKPESARTTQEIAADLERKAKNQRAKTRSIKVRRKEFAQDRAQAVLLMLDSGVDYICCVDGCEESEYLTVDHIKPLSKGGSDDVSNLQFMCKSHNSSKNDR